MIIVNICLFILSFTGSAMLFSGLFPGVSPAAKRAVSARTGKKQTLSSALIDKISVKLLPFMSIDKAKGQRLRHTLIVLGRPESPELFHAKAWANGIVYFVGVFTVAPTIHLMTLIAFPGVFPVLTVYQFGIFIAAAMLFVGRGAVHRELDNEFNKRRQAIEWELPQFSGMVLQSLGHTRNVVDILTSYRKICGPALEPEIGRMLNDMRTGNQEQAVNNLAARVNSGAFTQLAQGLIGILRGDDQISYFQIITNDFQNTQNELIEKELLKRPGKLAVNNVILLVGMVAMFGVAIGGYLLDTSARLF